LVKDKTGGTLFIISHIQLNLSMLVLTLCDRKTVAVCYC